MGRISMGTDYVCAGSVLVWLMLIHLSMLDTYLILSFESHIFLLPANHSLKTTIEVMP